MPDFSLLSMPNFAQAALSGYNAGQNQAKSNQLDAALGNVDLTRPETVLPVLRADPSTGTALLGAAQTMAKAHMEAAGRHALASVILNSRQGGGDPSASAQGAPSPVAANTAATALTPSTNSADPTGDIVVTGQRPSAAPAWSDAERALIEADPHAFLEAQSGLGKLNDAHLAQIKDAADAQAAVSLEAGKLPYAQRKAFIAQQSPYLMQHGVTQATIDAFDPTDSNLSTLQTQALGVKDTLAQRDKDRAAGFEQERIAETHRHNSVDEGQGAARIGLEGANVGIARAHLGIAERADARAAAAAGAKAAPMGVFAAPTTKAAYDALPKGTHYRAPDGTLRIK